MAKIKLDPALLTSQSQQMNALAGEYQNLFSGVVATLKSMDDCWSEVLSANFTGKITTAQNSFSNVTELLQQGAQAAQLAATTLGDVDAALANVMSGKGSGGSGTVSPGTNPVVLPEEEGSSSSAREDAENYTGGRGGYSSEGGGEGALGGGGSGGGRGSNVSDVSETTSEKQALDYFNETLQGKPDWGGMKEYAEDIAGETGRKVVETVENNVKEWKEVAKDIANDSTYQDLSAWQRGAEVRADQELQDGNWLGAIKEGGKAVLCFGAKILYAGSKIVLSKPGLKTIIKLGIKSLK